MSRYWDDAETMDRRIWRGVIVQEFGPAEIDLFDYIHLEKHGELP